MPPFLAEITFVSGYDREAAPRQTPGSDDDSRFAIVLDTYHPTSPDASFDFEFYKTMLPRVVGEIQADRVQVKFDDGTVCSSIDEAIASIERTSDEDREPPRLVELFVADRRCAVVETEDWVHFGGPSPYHDTYTFVFYAEETLARRFAAACRRIAGELGLRIVEVAGEAWRRLQR